MRRRSFWRWHRKSIIIIVTCNCAQSVKKSHSMGLQSRLTAIQYDNINCDFGFLCNGKTYFTSAGQLCTLIPSAYSRCKAGKLYKWAGRMPVRTETRRWADDIRTFSGTWQHNKKELNIGKTKLILLEWINKWILLIPTGSWGMAKQICSDIDLPQARHVQIIWKLLLIVRRWLDQVRT